MTDFRAIAALVGAFAVAAPAASLAATFDFATMADQYYSHFGYEGDWNQMVAFEGGAISNSGVTVTGAATYTQSTGNVVSADPFFDSSYGMPGPAGLGVCHSGTTNGISNCASPYGSSTSDDNLTLSELLTLGFDHSVKLTSLTIRDGNHNLITNSAAIVINGISYGAVDGVVSFASPLTASSFDFQTQTSGNPEIYLSTMSVAPVPLPAGILLLPGALAFTGFAARKRRRKAAA